jgi:alkanesulfonate monooxygenase SsuD/methylene tetrahydromethanopterin reductase-like flavin-dependent oxidoreductase (luciferase family)
MIPVIVGRSASELTARRDRARAIFPRMPEDAVGWRAAGFLHGTPSEVGEELRRWEALGIGRVMLQMLDMEDLAAIDLLAREVLPAFR